MAIYAMGRHFFSLLLSFSLTVLFSSKKSGLSGYFPFGKITGWF
jgi:hypothetical protein